MPKSRKCDECIHSGVCKFEPPSQYPEYMKRLTCTTCKHFSKQDNGESNVKLKKIADYYRFTSQADMLCEEAAAFMVALNKFSRGNCDAYSQVEEKLADVLVVAEQLRYLIGENIINPIMNDKINRQLRRIEEEVQRGDTE